MSCSAVVATLSCLFAALSALFARWAWREARRANDLSVHPNRVGIYIALCDLRCAVEAKGVGVTNIDVAPFFRPSREAELYFSDRETSEKVKEYYDACFRLAECTRKLDRPNNSQADVDGIHKEQDRLSELEQSLFVKAKRRVLGELRRAVKPRNCVL